MKTRVLGGMACALMVFLGAVSADEIHLRDGQVLEGEVVSEPDAKVVELRMSVTGMVATRHIPRGDILFIRVGQTPAQLRLAALAHRRVQLGSDGTADDWRTLARDARQAGDLVLWRACTVEVLNRDRRDERAHQALNHVLHRGVWMRTDELQSANGLIRFRDQWVSWGDKERVLALESQQQEDLRVDAEAHRKVAMIAALAAQGGGGLYPPTNSPTSEYRVVYWPTTVAGGGFTTGSTDHASHGSVGARGGNDHLRWQFHWDF